MGFSREKDLYYGLFRVKTTLRQRFPEIIFSDLTHVAVNRTCSITRHVNQIEQIYSDKGLPPAPEFPVLSRAVSRASHAAVDSRAQRTKWRRDRHHHPERFDEFTR